MSVLVDKDILLAMDMELIKIVPFDRECLGTNSYDVHLGPTLRTYKVEFEKVRRPMNDEFYGGPAMYTSEHAPLDCRKKRDVVDHVIPAEGFVLQPQELYLASTVEYTESLAHVPELNGKSSIGRLSLSIHVTAGTGDVGFCNHWTMELFVIKPLRVYAGMPIGQLLWHRASGRPQRSYGMKPGAKYNQVSADPMPSEMAKNFDK